jgi:hypothetical protein
MDESSAQKFNKNTPEWLIIENWKEKSEKTQVVESNFNTWFTSFIEKNIWRFNIWISVYWSRQSKLFVEFRDFVDRWELEDAKISLIKFLNLQKRNLRWVKVGEKNKKPGDFIKEIDSLQSWDPKLAFVLQEFIDILFTDISTYKNIDKQHKTGKWEISNYKLAQERKRAFEWLADKILPGSSSDIKELRKIRVKEDVNKTWWNRGTQNNKDIFAAVASYKIAVDKENKIHSLWKKFLTMPPWMVSIADDKITSMDNCNKEELYEELFGAQTYKEQVKKAIISSIQKIDSNFVEDKLTDDNLKKLIINKTIEIDWKTISLPESKFIFFMYWRCYNESVGIKFGNLKIDVPWKASKTAGINLAWWEFVESTTTETDVQNFNVWLIVWDKEHHKHWKREWGWWTTTPIDPENPPPNPNPPSPPPTSDNSF